MSDYSVDVSKMVKKGERGLTTEIWAEIKDRENDETVEKRIWWEDNEGVHHDETVDLPPELRDAVDNAWIEKKRKW